MESNFTLTPPRLLYLHILIKKKKKAVLFGGCVHVVFTSTEWKNGAKWDQIEARLSQLEGVELPET